MPDATVKIYVQLLGDEKGTLRPTTAVKLKDNLFKILPTRDYKISEEIWEFPPGSVISLTEEQDEQEIYLLAAAP